MVRKVGDADDRPQADGDGAPGPVEDRIGDIERRLAALEATALVDETAIDRAWVDEDGGRVSRSQPDARHPRQALQAALDAHGRSATPASAAIEPDWTRLWEAATAMADVPSDGAADLRAKARALLLLCEEKSEDVVHRLASGIARDILALAVAPDRDCGD